MTLAAGDTLRIGLVVALASALAEVFVRAVQKTVLHQATQLNLNMTWMIPLAATVLFATVAIALALLSRFLPFLRRPVVPLAVFLSAVAAPAILSIGSLHEVAGSVLAIGIAVQAARILVRHVSAPERLARRALPALSILSLAVPAVTLGSAAVAGRLAIAGLAAPVSGSPNVLLIILDTVRASHLTPWGYERDTTPNLDRLARSGTLFESAWSASPWTLSSHASTFTGQYVNQLSTSLVHPLDDTWPTLAEHYRDLGYATAGFTANLRYTSRETGLARGFARYEDNPVSAEMVLYSHALAQRITRVVRHMLGIDERFVRKHAPAMTDGVLEWIDGREGERPFFIFANYFDAHAPYLPPDSLAERFGPRRRGRALSDPSVREHWSPEEVQVERDAYDAMLVYLDGELGRLFDQLDARGLLDNTIVVVTADHGEQFGDHGLMDHGNSLYVPVLDVPLILRYPPAVSAGRRVAAPVSLRDLAATITDLTGRVAFPGTSLMPLVNGDSTALSPVLSEMREGVRTSPWNPLARGPMKSLIEGRFHYIRDGEGTEQLFDLIEDPHELIDLSAQLPARVAAMRNAVQRLTADEIYP